MSDFNIGDVVKFGKSGAVEYTVINVNRNLNIVDLNDPVNNRNRWEVLQNRLTLVAKAPQGVEDDVVPTSYQLAILSGVQGLSSVFGGVTVGRKFTARRAKNKVAKQSRKSNR